MRLVIPYLYSIALSLNNVVSRNFFERTLAVALSRTWLKWLGLQLFLSLLLSKYPKIITHCLSYRNQVYFFLQKNKNKCLKFQNSLRLKRCENLRTSRLKSKFTGSYKKKECNYTFFQH